MQSRWTGADLGGLQVFLSKTQSVNPRGGNCSFTLKKAMKHFKDHENPRKKGTEELKEQPENHQ